MSLEQQLERVAVALEDIANSIRTVQNRPTVASEPVKKPGRPAKVAAPAAPEAPVPPAAEAEVLPEDPFSEGEQLKAVTYDELKEILKTHSKTFGVKVTVALMIKHGADKTTQKMTSIPMASYTALAMEAEAELAKARK